MTSGFDGRVVLWDGLTGERLAAVKPLGPEFETGATGSVRLGTWWLGLVGVVTPAALVYVLIDELRAVLDEPYGGDPDWLIGSGVGPPAFVIALAVVLARLPWRRTVDLTAPSEEVSR